ncbi:hypothetical protein DSO57_1014909 [Entomophthora muscae]|uniref:Uncharacterized protein n=1 Tax=Entomophthora muscae TaxID=34485 RepID=A0ACC2T5D3_9FUNG|nr:hypothetical protein DSO57_1014909 [Entomophthora muscae]
MNSIQFIALPNAGDIFEGSTATKKLLDQIRRAFSAMCNRPSPPGFFGAQRKSSLIGAAEACSHRKVWVIESTFFSNDFENGMIWVEEAMLLFSHAGR